MQKILLLSVVLTVVGVPIYFGQREADPRLALKKTIWTLSLFNAFYLFALLFIYPRLG